MDLKSFIREIPDWPKAGVNFKDITPLLQNAEAFKYAIDEMAKPYENQKVDAVVGIDARGFIFAAAMAYKLGVGLVIVRKKGKLPWKTIFKEYALEYASNAIEMHEDAIKPGQKIIIADDVLATGGTMSATCEMVEKLGGEIVGISFLSELTFLGGIKTVEKYKVYSIVKY